MKFYHIISLFKLILGLIILIIDYYYIDIREDTVWAISLGLLGLFIFCWGISYYIFLFVQLIFNKTKKKIRIYKNSYKLSLLFGIYVMLNVLLHLGGYFNKIVGLILFVLFILLQVLLFSEHRDESG